jgi:NAD-dependent dihydropyrimidine dehydrogenase PreA subunit
MKRFRYLTGVATVKLDQAACVGCNRCLEVCPHQVFSVHAGKASLIDADACMECGACARNCLTAAITVDAGVGCASGIIKEWLREHNLRVPGGGGCC